MTAKRDRVKELFLAIVAAEPDRRRTLLDALDPEVRKEVESLLIAHEDDHGLEAPPAPPDSFSLGTVEKAVRDETAVLDASERIGAYRILRVIGEGGMGMVFEAEQQEPVRRKLALKIIKLGMDTKQIIARFESERQALALMSHPNVASVFDAGATERGRPYFTMELVQGVPITEYCDKHRLDLRQRLELFSQVCEGVQHAHHKGIIHRDIKPSNVLVSAQGDEPVPKIIDFGIAKATSQRLTERTVYTELGQLIGTPEYMSPEQAEMTGLDIDTRTDVYSLGVLLYELLVGAQPLDSKDLRQASLDEIRRRIRETDPPRPSTRLKNLGDASTTAATNRRVELPTLESALKGDLDWITMKALEKDRTRRYPSPSELAADIGRYLRSEPVLARPPSTAYRAGKFVRRHKLAVTGVAAVLIALLLGIVGTTLGLLEATRQRDEATRAREAAEREAAKAEAINEFLQETLGSANPLEGVGSDVTLLDALDAAVRAIEPSFSDQPEIEAEVRSNIGITYLRLRRYDEAEALLRRALAIRRQVLGNSHVETIESMTAMGLLYIEAGDPENAERLLREALQYGRELPAGERDVMGEARLNLASVVERRGSLDEAETLYREAERIFREAGEERAVAWAHSNLAETLRRKGDYATAESLYREALTVFRRVEGGSHPLVGSTLHGLALTLSRAGAPEDGQTTAACETALAPFEEALRIFDETSDALSAAMVRRNLARCLVRLGRFDDAEAQLLAAEATFTATRDDELATLAARDLVDLYTEWGKLEKAAEYRALASPVGR